MLDFNLDEALLFDIETDGLYDKVTKIYCMSYTTDGKVQTTTGNPIEVLKDKKILIGHMISTYDLLVLKKLLGFDFKGLIIDTLWLSWYLYPNRLKHGLEDHGEELGYPKVKVEDEQWSEGDIPLMIERCERDVEINWRLWCNQRRLLEELYSWSRNLEKFLRYLDFKCRCAAYQTEHPVKLDYNKAVEHAQELEKLQEEKVEALKKVMPKVPKYATRNPPKVTHKKDGSLSATGERWYSLLMEHKLPMTHKEPVKVITDWLEPNPGSTDQVKAWLYSLGWKPQTYKYVKDKETGNERKIEQVRKDGELCPSVLRLKDKEPVIEILEGLTVIQHRLGIFNGFIECAIFKCKAGCNGPNMPCTRECENVGSYYVTQEIGGLTNTLRWKHRKPLVNLPGVDKPWGKEIRGCLIAEDGQSFVGSDMSSLEATTKRHFIYPFDPDYSDEMGQEGFDEHLDLALKEGIVTQEQYDLYTTDDKSDPEEYAKVKKIRGEFKPVNYSAVYGIGVPKLARENGFSRDKAAQLLEAYWKRNWAVKKVSSGQYTKKVGGLTWLKNPVSGFYYELRWEKDTFSTLNQGTGVYIFDSWLARCAQLGYWGQIQFHDETGGSVTNESQTREILFQAIENLNRDLKLNVPFGIDVSFGQSYEEVH